MTINGIEYDFSKVNWTEISEEAYRLEGFELTADQCAECHKYAMSQMIDDKLKDYETDLLGYIRHICDYETQYLVEKGIMNVIEVCRRPCYEHIAIRCYFKIKNLL